MKRCKHENVFVRRGVVVALAKGVERTDGYPDRKVMVDARVCIGGVDGKPCGAWLSLGPSNDKPAEVQQEIRAAEIAGGARPIGCDDLDADSPNRCEECGMVDYNCRAETSGTHENSAGWLAQHILTGHDKDTSATSTRTEPWKDSTDDHADH